MSGGPAGAPTAHCACEQRAHAPRLVVVTGGPGAGKTALLELVRHHLCQHVIILPEAASIVFGGGFPRRTEARWVKAAQRAVYVVQRELERAALEDGGAAMILCDRGTLDGAAYWPGGAASWAADLGTTIAAEQARYAAVIQLRTPPVAGYNHENPLRIESAEEAARSDERINELWAGHTHHHLLASTPRFLDKIEMGVKAIEAEVPPCCRVQHAGTAA